MDVFSVGPLNIGLALNITAWRYAGKLNFTALGCPLQLPDAHVVANALQAAFDELQLEFMGRKSAFASPTEAP